MIYKNPFVAKLNIPEEFRPWFKNKDLMSDPKGWAVLEAERSLRDLRVIAFIDRFSFRNMHDSVRVFGKMFKKWFL